MRAAQLLFGIVVAGVIVGGGALAYAMRYGAIDPITPPNPSTFDRATVDKGKTLALLGDCAVCHTRPGGDPFSGGLPLKSPYGIIYTTNITPDPDTGIGKWSEVAFKRAMREGVDNEGHYLYPAFPYDRFTKTTDEDIHALYAFLMSQKPVKYEAPETALAFPYGIRLGVAAWNFLYLKQGPDAPDASKDAAWNRGRYIVEGLGHCGSCHSPRNFMGAEILAKVYQGGDAEGWAAPALGTHSLATIGWNEAAYVNYLIDGWDKNHGVTAGPMTPVINDLAEVNEDEVSAIAKYLASLGAPAAAKPAEQIYIAAKDKEYGAVTPPPTMKDPAAQRGQAIFGPLCANCHKAGGTPVPMALYSTVVGPNPANLIHVIIDGVRPPKGARDKSMPAFGASVTDANIADLATYIRAQFTDRPAWTDIAAKVAEARAPKP